MVKSSDEDEKKRVNTSKTMSRMHSPRNGKSKTSLGKTDKNLDLFYRSLNAVQEPPNHRVYKINESTNIHDKVPFDNKTGAYIELGGNYVPIDVSNIKNL